MTIEELKEKLVAAVVDNALPLTTAATGSETIGKLIDKQLGITLLAISGGDAPPGITITADGTAVLVEGTAKDGSGASTVIGIEDALLRCFFTLSGPASNVVEFSLAATAPTVTTTWKFETSFPALKDDAVFSQLTVVGRPFFVVTSHDHRFTGYNPDKPEQPFDVTTATLNLQAETTFGKPWEKLPGPLKTSDNLVLQGGVEDRVLGLLSLIASPGKSYEFMGLVSIKDIRYYAQSELVEMPAVNEDVDEEPSAEETQLYSQPGIIGRVASLLGTSPDLELNSSVPFEGSQITLQGEFPGGGISLTQMTAFLFGSTLSLPAPLQSIFDSLKLFGFGIKFDFEKKTLLSVSLTSIYDSPIAVIPGTDYLTFSDLRLIWTIENPTSSPTMNVGIDGVVTILGAPLSFDAAMPSYVLSGGLDEDDPVTVDLPALLSHVGLPPQLLPTLVITEINFEAAPTQMHYALAAEVTVDETWALKLGPASFRCSSFAFDVDYAWGVITGSLEFNVLIQDIYPFFARGEYTGAEDGWVITAGKRPEDKIELVSLAASYLPFPFTVPDSLKALLLTELLVVFNTGDGTYDFRGAVNWELDMFPGSPKITASVQIGTKLLEDGETYETSGVVKGTLEIYGLKISTSYTFRPKVTVIAFVLDYYGRTLTCGIERTEKKTVLTASLGNVTFGDVLQFMVGLLLPGYHFELGSPWNVLNKISFNGLALKITQEETAPGKVKKTISIEYPISIDLIFFQLTKIGLTVLDGAQGNTVKLDLYGTMLGKDYEKDPLSWDMLNDPAPTVPGQGDQLLDLRYLAFGQNVALRDARTFNTLDEALNSLQDFKPVDGNNTNPLAAQNALVYSGDSSWLIGADFTVMGAVTLGMIFNDPQLYGLRVALAGEKVKSLAGLTFEILYKKVTDTIGVYQIELKLPDSIRQLQLGAISLTIPIIGVQIYTNGNFRIDMGFPTNGDFSRSFCMQVWPFIGYGGFYFAVLDGATSSRVPVITNGTFSPVIEFGIALSLGLGKTIDYGVLKAGLSLTVEGIVEGVLAWFNPSDTSQPSDTYFWLQGTVAIVGKLYGTVDFVIIKATVNITASASITLTVQAYAPIDVYIELMVEASVSVKVLFFTVNMSFSMKLDFSFTIGTASRPPWEIAANPAPPANKLLMRGRNRTSRRLLAAARRPQALLMAMGDAPPTFDWSPVAVFGGALKTIPLTMAPSLTPAVPSSLSSVRANGAAAANDPAQVEMVMALYVENSVAPPDGSPRSATANTAAFNWLGAGMLLWSLGALKRANPTVIGAADLEAILAELDRPEVKATAFSYGNLSALLGLNYVMEIASPLVAPTGPTGPGVPLAAAERFTRPASVLDGPVGIVGAVERALRSPMMAEMAGAAGATGMTGATGPMSSATVFPMIPDLVMSPAAAPTIDFATQSLVGPEYEANLDAYFKQLQVDYESNVARNPIGADSAPPMGLRAKRRTVAEGKESMATFIFRDYFAMIASAAVQSATDLLRQYPYTVKPNDSLCSIAGQFGPTGAMCDPGAAAADAALAADDDTAITVEAIGAANAGATLVEGARLDISGVQSQTQSEDSFASITQRLFLTPADLPGFFTDPRGNVANTRLLRAGTVITIPQPGTPPPPLQDKNIKWYETAIRALNPEIRFDEAPLPPVALMILIATFVNGEPVATENTTSYAVVSNDTLAVIARTFCMRQTVAAGLPWCTGGAPDCSTRLVTTPGGTGPGAPISYTIRPGDTFRLLSDLYCVCPADIALANFKNTEIFVPLAVLVIPTIAYSVQAADTIASVAGYFDLTIDDLSFSIRFNTGIFAQDSTVIVPDVRSLAIETLIASIIEHDALDTIATTVSNFLLHGLRVPSPEEDHGFLALAAAALRSAAPTPVELWGLYELIGQQFTAPPLGTPTYAIDFAKQGAAPWITFAGGETALNVTVTAKDLQENYPSTTFDPHIVSGPSALPLYRMVPERWSLGRGVQWQSAAPVELPTGATGPVGLTGPQTPQGAGQPSIWLFPEQLATRVGSTGLTGPTGMPRPYELVEVRRTTGSGQAERTIEQYAWGTAVELSIRRITEEGGPATGNAYLMLGADEAGRVLLQQLWSYLHATRESATLSLLYAPNATGANPTGLASDTIDPAGTFLLKTNLSTITHSGPPPFLAKQAVSAMPPAGDYFAQINAPMEFVQYLWECSIVGTGGYYLNYRNTVGGTGLPDDVFSNGDSASIWLVAQVGSQSNLYKPNRTVYPFNNCALLAERFDASVANIFAQVRGATGADLLSLATVPPGNVGFSMSRKNPDLMGATGPVGRTASLYNLLGYSVGANEYFGESNEAVPIGPANPEGATGPTGPVLWDYQQIVPVAQFGRYNVLPGGSCADGNDGPIGLVDGMGAGTTAAGATGATAGPLPASAANPYAGITGPAAGGTGPASSVVLDFAFHDIFGNRIDPTTPVGPLSITVGYIDSLIPVSAWPSAASAYLFTEDAAGATGPAARLSWVLNLQVDKYMPGAAADLVSALTSASTDVLRYSQVYYQMVQPDVTVTLRTSLDQKSPTSVPAPYAVSKAPLVGFAAASYVFLDTVQHLQQVTASAVGSRTLGDLAGAYSVDAGALVDANRTRSSAALFSGSVIRPAFTTAGPDDTLAGLAADHTGGTGAIVCPPPTTPLTPAMLAENNRTLPLGAGLVLRTQARPFVIPAILPAADNTLAKIAALARSTVAYQFGTEDLEADQSGIVIANYTTPDIIAPDVPITIDGITVTTTQESTFRSLFDAFAAKELRMSRVQFATAIADVAGIFRPERAITLDDTIAGNGETFAGLAARITWTIAAIATMNAAVPNVFTTGAAVYVSYTCVAPSPVPLEEMLTSQWRITSAQFAAFNAGTTLVEGAAFTIPNLATIDESMRPFYAPYQAPFDTTLAAIAELFGITPLALATADANIPGVFATTAPIVIGACSVKPTIASTICTVYEAFAACDPKLTFAAFVKAIATMPGILATGALWAPPLPAVPADGTGAGRSLAWIAEHFRVLSGDVLTSAPSPATLAAANSALDGLLAVGATVYASAPVTPVTPRLTVNDHDTFTTLVYRFKTELDVTTTARAIALANADAVGLLTAGARFLLPPNPVWMASEITPRVPDTIFPISVTLELNRSVDMVAPDFTRTPAVRTASSPMAAQATPNMDGTQSLVAFAERFERAFDVGVTPNRLRLKAALGRTEDAFGEKTATQKLWAVNFGDAGIRRFDIVGAAPGFYALAPLATTLSAGTTLVYAYDPTVGLVNPGYKTFQAVDLDLWMREFLATVDLFLTPGYSVPAFQLGGGGTGPHQSAGTLAGTQVATRAAIDLTPSPAGDGPTGLVGREAAMAAPALAVTAGGMTGGMTGPVPPGRTSYESIVDAKERIATLLAKRVQPILNAPGQDDYLDAAREALREQMLIELGSAYAVDAIVRYPVDVRSSFTKDPAPRVSGPIQIRTFTLAADATLAEVAGLYDVAVPYVALGLATAKGVLRPGIAVTYRGATWCIRTGDTLADVAVGLGVDPVITSDAAWAAWREFIAAIDTTHPLCAPLPAAEERHPLILANSTFDLGRIDRRITVTDTLETLAAYLNVSVPDVARANEALPDLYNAGAPIPYCAEAAGDVCTRPAKYAVQPGQTLTDIVVAINAIAALPVTVESIALATATTAGITNAATTVHGLQPQTESSFTTTKVDLRDGTMPPLLTLFSIKQRSLYRKAFFALDYVINELEYDIADVANIDDYQSSSWLTFLLPIGGPADPDPVVDTSIGQVEIPLPLRAYPAPPSMLGQFGFATDPDAQTIADARRWTYEFSYESRNAAQDTTYLTVAFGGTPEDRRPPEAALNRAVFSALAQFIDVAPALANDLSILPALAPGAQSPTAQTAAGTLAAIAQMVAEALERSLKLAMMATVQPMQVYDFRVDTASDAQRTRLETLTLDLLGYTGPVGPSTVTRKGVTGPPGGWPDLLVRNPAGATAGNGFVPMIPSTQTATEAAYRFPAEVDIPTASSMTLMYSFPARDIVLNPDGSAAVYLTRNQELISSGPIGATGATGGTARFPTNDAFVYRTPMVRFAERMVPLVTNGQQLTVACIPAVEVGAAITAGTLATCIAKMFDDVLGLPSGAPANGVFTISIAVSYGYTLAQPSMPLSPGVADIVARIPILLRPTFDFDTSSAFIPALAHAIESWTEANDPNPDGGFYMFDITLYTHAGGATGPASPTGPIQPTLQLSDVRIPLGTSGRNEGNGPVSPEMGK